MSLSRRSFLGSALAAGVGAAGIGAVGIGPTGIGRDGSDAPGRRATAEPSGRSRASTDPSAPEGYDPWIEVSPSALRANVREIGRVTEGRPIMATIKNNGYGLGLERVAPVLDEAPEVAGLAVVKVAEALRLREVGVQKPILLMTRTTEAESLDLVRQDVRLAPFSDGDGAVLERVSRELQRPVPVHLYLDTGMSRLGMPYHRALPWIEELANRPGVEVEGCFMGFTESPAFDREQLERFIELAARARSRNLPTGRLHAGSSNHLTFLPESFLDMVRPGLNLFGAHVAGGREEGVLRLTPAFRLRARVLRVERLRVGDSVSYGRNYVAEDEVWVATIPMGHADGYPRQAVDGVRILVGERSYPVIGAVSASHCIIEVGRERTVQQGDIATLLGPDHPDIHPNQISEITGRSVYDVLMHLNSGLPGREWVE